ncbi:hypothetical protein ABVK25_007996 [Lepraria finkii]|uniref:Uncharacterized protein n=1 Tax=Lepraria finkii TaxID=1340010 RepID=A0ABR4B2P1_9LECA
MDTAIFNGALRGKIAVLWAEIKLIREVAQDKETMVLGMTASFGEIDSGTAMVCLNSDEIFEEPEPQKMWETVIHELVYTYLDITCGNFEPHLVGVAKDALYQWGPKMMSVMPLWVKCSLEGDEEVINELRASMANTSKITEPKDEEDTAEPESSTTDLAKEEMREELNKD